MTSYLEHRHEKSSRFWSGAVISAVILLIAACSQRDAPAADVQPGGADAALADAARPDRVQTPDQPGDQTLDCPVLELGDAAAEMGWRVAHVASHGLHAVSCAEGHVFAAGNNGSLLHRAPSASLCAGFSAQNVPTQADLLTVSFADLSYGVAAGREREIWETRDAGETWSIAPQCGDVIFDAFTSLHLHSATKGYGAGFASDPLRGAYKIYTGKVWICPDQTFANQVLYGAFRQQDNGWFVGATNGRIYHTPDEGFSWFFTDTTALKPLHAVFFTPAGIGLAAGEESEIQRSEDGRGWSRVATLGMADLAAVFFWDDTNGWIVGSGGTILRTQDGGKTWANQRAPVAERLEGVCFTSPSIGWVVGEEGTILATTTGGE